MAAAYFFRIDVVGDADEVEHGGEAQLVTAGAEEGATDEWKIVGLGGFAPGQAATNRMTGGVM
jgi:hypothetical protein